MPECKKGYLEELNKEILESEKYKLIKKGLIFFFFF